MGCAGTSVWVGEPPVRMLYGQGRLWRVDFGGGEEAGVTLVGLRTDRMGRNRVREIFFTQRNAFQYAAVPGFRVLLSYGADCAGR